MIALKTSQSCENQDERSSSQNLEDDLALISRKIQRMVFRRNQNRRPFQNRREPQKVETDKSKV